MFTAALRCEGPLFLFYGSKGVAALKKEEVERMTKKVLFKSKKDGKEFEIKVPETSADRLNWRAWKTK